MYTIEFMVDKFVTMQKEYFEVAKQELTNQKKIRHWMWFMLPQLKGLGESDISFYYGIEDLEEARQYYENDYLKQNLNELVDIMLKYKNIGLESVLGIVDTRKVNSCMTLFYLATKEKKFKMMLDKFYGGCLDIETMLLLKRGKQL